MYDHARCFVACMVAHRLTVLETLGKTHPTQQSQQPAQTKQEA